MEESLEVKIQNDLKAAMKMRDDLQVQTLRMLLAAFRNHLIEKRAKAHVEVLTADEYLAIVKKEAKKRSEAISAYREAKREDLRSKEEKELLFIQRYLPQQMGEKEILAIIEETMQSTGLQQPKDFGALMSVLVKKMAQSADSSLVARLLKERLHGKEL